MSILSGVDLYSFDSKLRKAVSLLQKEITEARLFVRDYELAETKEDQLDNAKNGRKLLNNIRKNILISSEYNVFNPVEVAELSAKLDLIIESLE